MLSVLQELTKVRITVAVTLSVATGHFLFTERAAASVLLPAAGVFLLACGSAALNQVQEAGIDRVMTRTRGRPIPSGRIGADWALFIAVVLMCGAFYLLSLVEAHTYTVLGLAAAAVVWYNGVYTYLKRLTAFAVVPGALVGALPPLIGWASGGGVVLDPSILDVAFFFFIWQIPHFWLLLLMYGRDYEEAGLPSLTRKLAPPQIRRITAMWIIALAATGLLMAVTEQLSVPWKAAVLAASVWLFFTAWAFLRDSRDVAACLPAFIKVNLYALAVMVFLVGDAVT